MKNFIIRHSMLFLILVAACSYCISGTGANQQQTDRQPAVASIRVIKIHWKIPSK